MHSKKDHELQHAVLGELEWETRVRETDIGVTVRDGIVTLTGTVDCWAEKQAAQEAAHRVRGVLDVANDITIKPTWNTEVSDTEIAKAARTALDWNVNVPRSCFEIDVWNGLVKLSGIVETLQQRVDAENAIRVIRGVCGIESSVIVQPPNVAPDALRAAIEGALDRHVSREAKRISIEVEGDYVRLSGEVDSKAEHEAALGAVIGTRGVRAVEDRLRVAT